MIKWYFNISFASRVLIWMVIGSVLGVIFGEQVLFLKPIGEIFLQLLVMAAIPLVFFNLLAGVSSIGSKVAFGKIGIKIFVYYLISTSLAITVGLVLMQITGAGYGMTLKGEIPENVGSMPDLGGILISMVPTNIFKSFAEGNLIQIVIIAILLGVVVLNLPSEKQKTFTQAFEKATDLMRGLVELILKASPLGLGALMAGTFAEHGGNVLGPLLGFIGTVYAGHLVMVILYMMVLISVKVKPFWFLSKTSPLYATTIATCSSLASLAVALEVAEQKLKLPRKIFSFTLPLGAQFNKDGSSIMLSAVLIFTAQAIGLEFSISQMVQIVVVGLIISEGSSGIPGGSLVIAMLFAQAFNLPLEIVAVIGGIYRLIDMGNTTVNCMGDMVATSVVSKIEKQWTPNYEMDTSSTPTNQE